MLIDFLLYRLHNRTLNLLYIRNRSTFVLFGLQGKLSTKSTGGKGQCKFTFFLLSFPLQFSSISLCVCYVVQFVVAQHFNVILSTCNKKHNKISITTRAEVTTTPTTTTTIIVASTWNCVKQTLHLLLHSYESCFSNVSLGGGGGRAESLAKHYAPSQVQCLPQSLT